MRIETLRVGDNFIYVLIAGSVPLDPGVADVFVAVRGLKDRW